MWMIVFSVLAAGFAVGDAGMMPGGFTNVSASTPAVQNALNFAVARHNHRNNEMFIRKPYGAVTAKAQVVSGMKYVITVEMGKTPCKKTEALELCAVPTAREEAEPYLCKFTVWSRPWMNQIEMIEEKCPLEDI